MTREHLFCDMRQGQVTDDAILRRYDASGRIVEHLCSPREIVVRQHHSFRIPRRATGIDQGQQVIGL